MIAIWLFLRAESRRRWRAWLFLALIVGVFAGGVMTAAAGALRTDSVYARLLDWSRAPDSVVFADPYVENFARLAPAAVTRVPQATDAAVIKNFNVTASTIQLFAPASNAVPGGFWKRKILSGRLADPDRPSDLDISFTLAERFHLRPGDSLRLVLLTADGRPRPFVFRVAGIHAAQMEFPPQPGNGTYVAWGTPAFYRQHQTLAGFAQVALRLRHGSADWPLAQRELAKHADGKLVQAALLSDQSVNTERSIRPQAVALWLLAALFGIIGLFILGQLLARQSFMEAAGFGTMRALGMTRAQLMAACLVRAAAIGAAGGLIGGMLAVALSPLLPVGLARVAEPHPGIDANVPALVVGVVVAIVVTAGCAAWPGSAPAAGRLPRTSQEIALGTKTLRELHARIGTTIGVSLDNSPPRPMTIVGTTVFPSLSDKLGLGTGAALTPSGLRHLVPDKAPFVPPGDVLVRFRPSISPQAGRHALAAQLARLGSFTVDGPATPTDLVNFGQVQNLPQALGAGLAAVALLTIAHLLMTSVRRRQRDVAILRAFGFTPRQVRRAYCWQAVTLAGIALVIGIPAGIACGRLCWQVFAHQLGIIPVTAVPLAALSIMAASWLAAAMALAALSGGRGTRTPPARILHSE